MVKVISAAWLLVAIPPSNPAATIAAIAVRRLIFVIIVFPPLSDDITPLWRRFIPRRLIDKTANRVNVEIQIFCITAPASGK
jgi:hypothetical protein